MRKKRSVRQMVMKPMFLPAAAGTCAMCATVHGQDDPHNFWSLFYQTRFRAKYGRKATHADACAHLQEQQQAAYREVLEGMGKEYTVPEGEQDPRYEPYAESGA